MIKVENKDKVLYFFTSSFPFGSAETFIENEIDYLANHFNKIYIISNNLNSTKIRKTPENVFSIRIRYELNIFEKILCLGSFFSAYFWRELHFVKFKYKKKISFGIIKTVLISFYNAKRLIRKFKKLNILNNCSNYYYSYWSNDNSIALALLKLKYNNLKCFSRIHGWDVFFGPSKYNYLPFRNLISNHLNAVFSISEKGLNYCVENWKIDNTSALKLSRLGVRNGLFLETVNSEFLLISCSNIISLKRLDLLVKSLAKITFDVQWVHFGDGDLMQDIISLCDNILPKNISFEFKGRVDNNEILQYYKAQNPSLFINLSSSEGVPVSIMEAMSFGIPVIATNVGGNSEIVNNENGYLLEESPTSLKVANKIEQFYNLALDENKKKKKAAFQTWDNKFNAKKNYTQFINDIFQIK